MERLSERNESLSRAKQLVLVDERKVDRPVFERRATFEFCAVVIGLLVQILFGSISVNIAEIVRVFVLDSIELVAMSSLNPQPSAVQVNSAGRLAKDLTWCWTLRCEDELREEFSVCCVSTELFDLHTP